MRWVYRAFKLIVTLSILGVLALALVPGKKLADLAVGRIEALSGREVTLQGDVTTKIFPRLSVQTGPMTLSNADWAESSPMLTAEGLDVGVELLPLLKGDFVFRDIKVLAPKVRLEVSKDGLKNWEFSQKVAQSDSPASQNAQSITVDFASVDGGDFQYINHQTGESEQLQKVDLTARFPDIEGQIDIAVSGFYKDTLFDAEIAVGRPMGFLADEIVTVQTSGQFGGANLAYNGKLGLKGPVMDGQLTATMAHDSTFFKTLKLGTNPFSQDVTFSGAITRTADGAVYVRGGEMDVEHHVLRGDIDVTLGKDRPMIKGVIVTQDVDFKPLLSPPTPKSAPGNGWSEDVIKTSQLFAVDAEIALEAASIDFGAVRFGESNILLKLGNGRAVFDLKKVTAYGGTLAGEFVANGRSGGSVGGDLRASGVKTGPLFGALLGYDRLESTADGSFKFLGVGNSLAAIMSSLSGTGNVSIKEGVLNGIDFEEMIRRLDLSYRGEGQETVFNGIDASFSIQNGVLSNNDLIVNTNLLEAKGQGQVNLSAKTLDYRLTPTALAQEGKLAGVRVPLLIKGPWSQPTYGLDIEAIVDQELSEEKAALEAKVKAARDVAKADAAKKLGVSQLEGESLEDAARRTIEENAAKELLKLLGGN